MTEAQINIKIDNKSGQKTVDELNSSLKETTNQSKSLKSQLREMTNALNQLEPGTAEFQKMAVEAGKLRDQIKDTQAVINATAGSVGENLGNAFGKIAGVGINAFQGIMGVQAMFGSDSKELMEIMAKLQGAMAVSQAIAGFGQLSDTIIEVRASLIAAATSMGILKTQTVATTVATEGATIAQEGLNVAMKANPIGLIITGLVALVSAIAIFSSSTDDAAEKQKKLNDELKKERDEIDNDIKNYQNKRSARKDGVDELQREVDLLKAKGASDKEIYKAEKRLINEQIAQLDYARGYRGYLLSEEVKQYRDLQNEKKILDAEYTRKVKEESNKRAQIIAKENEKNRQEAAKQMQARIDSFVEQSSFMDSFLEKYYSKEQARLNAITRNETEFQKLYTQNAIYRKRDLDEIKLTEEQIKKLTDTELKQYNERIKNINDLYNQQDYIFTQTETKVEERINNYYDSLENITKIETQINENKIKSNYKNALVDFANKYETYQLELKLLDEQQKNEINSSDNTQAEINRIISEYAVKRKEINDKWKESFIQTNNEIVTNTETAFTKITNKVNDWITKNQELINAIANMAMTAQDLVGQYFDELNARTEYTIQQSYDNQLAAYEKLNENKKISDEQLAERQAELEQTYNAQKRGLAQKQFRQDKALNIVQATIQGVQATLAAFTQGMKLGGPIGAGIFAGISAAFVAAQIGIIASQKFRFSKGGIVQGEGSKNIDSVPGMLAPGETVINSTSSGLFPELLSAINMIGGGLGLTPDSKVNNVASSQTPMLFQQQMNMSPVRAYVVESDITQTQRRISRFERNNKY